jgi:hypothetical protein
MCVLQPVSYSLLVAFRCRYLLSTAKFLSPLVAR